MGRRSATCECGNAKRVGDEACARCMELDGTSIPETTLIQTLRALGGKATSDAIMLESGHSYRQFRRTAAKLEASGRLVRVEDGQQYQKNVPLLVLAERQRATWRQLPLPRCSAYLEEAVSTHTVERKRRISVRRRRARMVQMSMRFRGKKPTEPERRAS